MISCYKELIFMLRLQGYISLPMENLKYLLFHNILVPGIYFIGSEFCYYQCTWPIAT